MPVSAILDRRLFLAAAAALAGVAATAAAADALPRTPAAPALDPYSLQLWEPLVGSALAAGLDRVHLTAVNHLSLGFGLVFEFESPNPTEGIYSVLHPAAGPVDLYMTTHERRALAIIVGLPQGMSL